MKNKKDFKDQIIDDTALYLPCFEVSKLAGKSRGIIFRDINLGRLPAVWHATFRNGKKCRAYLIHPDDAMVYIEKVKGKVRVNWGRKPLIKAHPS